jgi:hypothetical protein
MEPRCWKAFPVMLFIVACSGTRSEPDAGGGGGGGGTEDAPAGVACSCCTPVPFTADHAVDVASDGSAIYVTDVTYVTGASSQRLGRLTGDGAQPVEIAAAETIELASFPGVLFYAAGTGSMYELHERVGATDRVLGSVTSVSPIQIAGNATDLYVSGTPTAGAATLWRFSRAAPEGTPPQTVANEAGNGGYLALGSTVAVWLTSGATTFNSWLVSLPGPSTPSALPEPEVGMVFVGDAGVLLHHELLTSHASRYRVDQAVPTMATVFTSSLIINGGAGSLLGDPARLYWHETTGSVGPGVTSSTLETITLDGNRSSICAGWPSDILRGDATHLYGLHEVSAGHFAVEVVAKL